jgi:Tol biopolymer transport system component
MGYDNYEVFRMRTDGSGVTRLTRTAAGVDDNAPEYSPDGRRIAFSSTRSGGQHDLFTMRSDGSDVRRLGGDTALDDVFPHWMADGKRLLFSTFAGPEGRPSEDVWVIDAGGTKRARVVADASADSSPDPRPRG